jgi:hypothetical protein
MWVSYFGAENVLVLPLEMLSNHSKKYLSELEQFMNIRIDIKESRTYDQVNYASQPKNYFLAKSIRKLRKKLNDLGLHFLVRGAKGVGLKKVFFEGGKEIEINPDDIKSLGNLFITDIENLLDLNIPNHIIKEYQELYYARK